jgi:hypothetical protein
MCRIGGAVEMAKKTIDGQFYTDSIRHCAYYHQRGTLPRKIQLFDYAGSIADLQETTEPKGQIARFLHSHKGAEQKASSSVARKI